jgi:hypothetical protein
MSASSLLDKIMAKEKTEGEEAQLASKQWRTRTRRWIIISII